MRLIDAPIRIIISIPIARRSIGDYQSGSSSGLDSWLCCAFPYESYSDIIAALLFLTAAGPRRLIPAFLLSLATPDLHIKLILLYHNPLLSVNESILNMYHDSRGISHI